GSAVVGPAVAANRREDAERERDADGEEERRAREQEGRGQALEDQAERVLLVTQRLAEVAAQGARQEAPVLDGERIVEAEALAELVHVLRLDVHGHEEQDRIAREAHHREDRGQREEDDERRLAEARQDVGPHGPTGPSE